MINNISKALDTVVRGWSRRATTSIKGKQGRKGMTQVTTWKDRKQVMFVHTHLVGSDEKKSYVKGQKERIEIDCPLLSKIIYRTDTLSKE